MQRTKLGLFGVAGRDHAASTVARAASAAFLLMRTGSAQADCIAPTPNVVWSSPAAGAFDVPVDADLLLVTEAFDLESAELSLFDGVSELPLERGSALPGHYDLPELEPNRAHTITLHPEQGDELTVAFTTGERRASNEDGPVDIVSIDQEPYATELIEDELCRHVLFRNTCWDTGIPRLQTFHIEAAAVAEHSLWTMESFRTDLQESVYVDNGPNPSLASWPAACGSPREWGALPSDAQYRVYNIGESGIIRESSVRAQAFELPPPAPTPQSHFAPADTDPTRGINCSVSSERARSTPALVAAAALALTAFWRRRRARAR